MRAADWKAGFLKMLPISLTGKKKFDSEEVNLLIWPFGTRTVKHGDFVLPADAQKSKKKNDKIN